MRELRNKTWAKLTAILLLVLLSAGAALCAGATALTWSGYGTAATFYEDALCLDAMDGTMHSALFIAVEGPNASGWYSQMLNRYAGFGYEVYEGSPEDGLLLESDSVPETYVLRRELSWKVVDGRYDSIDAEGIAAGTKTPLIEADSSGADTGGEPASIEYYTVVGYLPEREALPRYSTFYQLWLLWSVVQPLDGAAPLLTVLLALLALVDLGFLLYAAGHRQGREGVVPNWQDRIPLDLYLLCMGTAFACMTVAAMEPFFDRYSYSGNPGFIALGLFCILLAGLLALAALLSLATRLKMGKWWRNTVCYLTCRWCWRLCKRICAAARDLIRILPMTWRTILAVGGVLFIQSVLMILFYESYNSGFFFFVNLIFDGAIIVAAAWLSMQLQQIKDMGKALAAGDLEAKLDTRKLFWDVKTHAECLNAIGVGMNKAVEQRMKSERLKTELITNVSHDIKTPLTSIVNYVDLLKKEELPPAATEYLAVLDRQSRKLKKLTEDLVEASKASTGNVAVKLEPIVVNEIIHQAVGDYDEKLAAGKLEVIVNTYEGNLEAMADGRLLWRVLDNLLSNVCKYALAGTRVYIDLATRDGHISLSMKNISRDPLNINADELMERFVRGDASRHTEGSGLGLNIAKSLMELMGGSFALSVDGDLFKAELTLRAVAPRTLPLPEPIELK